jgi:hypothetical protein
MFAIMAVAFIVLTVGMTALLLFLGWQQHQIERREAEAKLAAGSGGKQPRSAAGLPAKAAPVG